MKRIIIVFTILFAACTVNAQTIEENKTDEFTGKSIVRTSWERIVSQMKGTMYCRISKINDFYYLDVKFSDGSVLAIADKAEMMFKLTSGEIITMKSIAHVIASKGAGAVGFSGSQAWGVQVSYTLPGGNRFDELEKDQVEKIRIYFTDGYKEFDIKDKFANTLQKMVSLVK